MKKNLLLSGAMSLLLLGSVLSCLGQEDSMKTLPPVVIYAKSNVDKAVRESFDKQFKDAMNQQWFRMNKDYLVTFITEDMKNNALFKKNGKLIYHIRFGQESNLPPDIKKQVQEAYTDYNITRAVNVKYNNRDLWVVNLEGLKKYIIVRVEDGELQEVENYDKAS
ncbi:MAG: hypothetical protein ACXVMS_09270 [Flavisolibacter sp.]